MKTLIAAAAAACLIFGAAAALDQEHHEKGHEHPAAGTGTEHGGTLGNGTMHGAEMHGGEMHGNAMMQSTHRNYDVHRYRRAFNAPRRFHAGGWHAPAGYAYRRWTFGQYLPHLYFERDYWLPNFAIYGLMAPPPGAVWVRYGPDALLIDEDTGEIIQVEYGVFF
ncbi:MAG TPA: RcnB family protein [Rhizomicrobium sp.]|nr:RcnB family protein [Rhizomicrobium sp.]